MSTKTMLLKGIPVLLFAALTLVYFSPLLKGKAIKQSDVANFKGMSKEIFDHRKKYDEEPLWTNSMFGGMPAYQISVLYPSNFIKPLTKGLSFVIPHPATIVFLSFLGFYFLLLVLGFETWLSALMAIAFGLSSYTLIVIEAGHNPKGYAIAYMGPVLAGLLMAFRGKQLLGASVFAVALSLQLSVNHVQITYYLMIACLFLAVGEAVRLLLAKQIKYLLITGGLLLIASGLAVGPNLTNLLLTQEYGTYSTRGKSELSGNPENQTSGLDKDYATQWSYGISETFTLMIPNFKGGASGVIGESNKDALKKVPDEYREYIAQMDQYFGDQPFTSGPVYLGALVCFLFVLAMFICRDSIKYYVLAAVVLSILLSWGKNFMGLTGFFMDHIPGYNKFRAVSMTLVIVQFLFPFLAAFAIREVLGNPKLLQQKRREFFLALGLTAGLCLFFYLLPDTFNSFYKQTPDEYTELGAQLKKAGLSADQVPVFLESLKIAREQIFTSDAMRSFLFIVSGALLLLAFSYNKINKSILLGGLGFLICIDMWTVDKRYLNDSNFVPKQQMDEPFEPSSADEQILKDTTPDFRVFNTTVSTFNDASTSYFHKSIGGYHGAKLKRYQELWENHISKGNMGVINMLNTKYFIQKNQAAGQDAEPVAVPNPGACGNAWAVGSLQWVPNADAELAALKDFNPRRKAIIDNRFLQVAGMQEKSFDTTATIALKKYKANQLVYTYHASAKTFFVFSEIFYDKGWKASCNGKELPLVRCNYVLRGAVVPPGNGVIQFDFSPSSYKNGETLAMFSSFLLLLFLGAGIYFEFRKRAPIPPQ